MKLGVVGILLRKHTMKSAMGLTVGSTQQRSEYKPLRNADMKVDSWQLM